MKRLLIDDAPDSLAPLTLDSNPVEYRDAKIGHPYEAPAREHDATAMPRVSVEVIK